MAVEIDLQTPGGVTADFDEALAPIGVIQIEVIVIGQHRFVARELKEGPFTGQPMGAEGIGFFLGDTDEDHRIAHRSLSAQLMSAPVFGFVPFEVKQRDALFFSESLDFGNEPSGDLA
jgi:hypothetical protein